MTIIRREIKFRGGFACESVVTMETVGSPLMFRRLRREVDVFSPPLRSSVSKPRYQSLLFFFLLFPKLIRLFPRL